MTAWRSNSAGQAVIRLQQVSDRLSRWVISSAFVSNSSSCFSPYKSIYTVTWSLHLLPSPAFLALKAKYDKQSWRTNSDFPPYDKSGPVKVSPSSVLRRKKQSEVLFNPPLVLWSSCVWIIHREVLKRSCFKKKTKHADVPGIMLSREQVQW